MNQDENKTKGYEYIVSNFVYSKRNILLRLMPIILRYRNYGLGKNVYDLFKSV